MADVIVPKWQKDLDFFLKFKPGLILEGEILDLQHFDGQICPIDNILHIKLTNEFKYDSVVFFNHVDGFYNHFDPDFEKKFAAFNKEIKREGKRSGQSQEEPPQSNPVMSGKSGNTQYQVNVVGAPSGMLSEIFSSGYDRGVSKFEGATDIIRRSLRNRKGSVCFVLELASRYAPEPDRLDEREEYFFSELFLALKEASKVKGLFNSVILLVDKVNDIPAWFFIGNQNIKTLMVEQPDKSTRGAFFSMAFAQHPGYLALSDDEKKRMKNRFADLTEGLKNSDLKNIAQIIIKENHETFTSDVFEDVIHRFKYGAVENPWTKSDSDTDPFNRLGTLHETVRKRLKGQDHAVDQAEDIIKRAVLGLSGIQHSSSTKPRGVMFLAGPTGVGKTEIAKTLATWLFGTEEAMLRFDMSEYSQGNSDQRLLGAPPGYVGYEAGGALTNAIKAHPFSILLFDEIEKAHPNIMDKFLQILEDGRMTDSHGETVYFTDSIIIFTSNIGFSEGYEKQFVGKPGHFSLKYEEWATKDEAHTYDAYRDEVLSRIDYHFDSVLGRKEIKNRIGENFIVFEYIDVKTAGEIMEKQLDGIVEKMADLDEHSLKLIIEDKAKDSLFQEICRHLNDGGRGVGNVLEKFLINPISAYLSDVYSNKGSIETLTIEDVRIVDNRGELVTR
ncbi:MAG: AAA family ATPase [Bacilli bacterium]|nr:AAA family ATPase [Bacilli bacterium]